MILPVGVNGASKLPGPTLSRRIGSWFGLFGWPPWSHDVFTLAATKSRAGAYGPEWTVGRPVMCAEKDDEPHRRHEMFVGVRLTAATPGSHLLDFLRMDPCAVAAWWIAADIDAVVRLSATSLPVLHRAVADLRRRGGAEVVITHSILRTLDLPGVPEAPARGGTARVPSPA
ncbi:hypothetical protein [Micromonospora sp. WMMD737]|uniref:hypothetical protein n=1 Tax=Micromonospora sp. WMMD737 TaxID=3404113 RepID=UPI003B92AE5A